ncbi:MAG: trehalose-6-phosphate synthase, partial [Mucilaginibacter sp.]
MSKTIIISNRLPVKVTEEDGQFKVKNSEGGLATGLGSVYQSGDNVWLGWPGIEVTEQHQQHDIKQQLAEINLVPVFLSADEITGYYEGFSNEILWPIFHYYASTYANYKQADWACYRHVNQKFADALAEIAEPGDTIWIHDYQLLLLPGLVRNVQPEATIGFFLHIPFPSFEMFRLIPWRSELIEGILGADLIGFHTFDDASHFISAATRLLPVNSSS